MIIPIQYANEDINGFILIPAAALAPPSPFIQPSRMEIRRLVQTQRYCTFLRKMIVFRGK